jgi:hypothetical protein
VDYEPPTTRKKLTHSAPNMVTRSAYAVRSGYHATGKKIPVAHVWCTTGIFFLIFKNTIFVLPDYNFIHNTVQYREYNRYTG